jgi:hypothetical protein
MLFRLVDSTTGLAKSGVDVTTLKLQYERPGEAVGTATSLTLLAALTTAWTSYGAREVDPTNSKGVYRVDPPDAAFATGADEVTLSVSGTGVETATRLIDLTGADMRNATNLGLANLDATIGSRLAPTAAGRTLDVSVGGEAGIDWANVGGASSTVALSGTTVGTLTTYTGDTPQTGDSFGRIGAAGAGLTAIPDEAGVTTLLSRLSAARSGYLDNLNAGGTVATGAQVTNLRFSVRAAVDIPATMERPDSGSVTIPFEVDIFNEGGAGLADPDSNTVTPAVVDNAGTDLSANLGGLSGGNLTRTAAGRYTGTYTLASTHALVELRFSFTWLRSTVAERIMVPSWVQDYTASAFTPSDRTNLSAVAADYMRRTDAVTVAAGGIGAAAFAAGAIDASAFSQAAADKAWSTTARTLTAFGFSVAVGDKTGFALTTAEHTAIAADVTAALNTAVPGSPTANSIFARIDNTIGSRMASFTYTAPDNTSIAAIKAKTDNLPADPASNTQVNTRLQGSAYTAPDNTSIAAILSLVGTMPGGLAGTVQDTGATTSIVKTSGLPTSGTYPAAGASLIIMWTSGPLAGRAEEATYTPGAAGTQQLAFSPVLPTAPANGNSFVAYEIPPTA